jgi:hypothetical protein
MNFKIVEVCHAISLGPETHFACSSEGRILDVKKLLPIQADGKEIATKDNAQGAPRQLRNFPLYAVRVRYGTFGASETLSPFFTL